VTLQEPNREFILLIIKTKFLKTKYIFYYLPSRRRILPAWWIKQLPSNEQKWKF